MTEQKLSLEETMTLARKFNDFGLWELTIGGYGCCETWPINNIHMHANRRDDGAYWLNVAVQINETSSVSLADYVVENKDATNFQKASDLFSEIQSKVKESLPDEYLSRGSWKDRTKYAVSVVKRLID